MAALYPSTEKIILVVPGEIPFTVNVALPALSVNALGVTVATVGEVLVVLISRPASGPPCLFNRVTNTASSEPEQTLNL